MKQPKRMIGVAARPVRMLSRDRLFQETNILDNAPPLPQDSLWQRTRCVRNEQKIVFARGPDDGKHQFTRCQFEHTMKTYERLL